LVKYLRPNLPDQKGEEKGTQTVTSVVLLEISGGGGGSYDWFLRKNRGLGGVFVHR